MAKVLRGKNKGQEVEIHQFCNDWVMLENGKIVSPTSLEYSVKEIERLKSEEPDGMFSLYYLDGLRLKKNKHLEPNRINYCVRSKETSKLKGD